MNQLRTGDVVTISIDRLSIGGRGVARHEGLVIFVPDSAPGDTLEIKLSFVKKKYAEGKILRIISPSPARIQPPCPVAGICGGCSWQHISYAEQLNQKHELVIEALRKFSGHFDPLHPEVLTGKVSAVVPSPLEFRYRNRIQLHHAPGVKGAHLGFFKRGSRQIVDISDCLITETNLTNRLASLKVELAQRPAGRLELFLTPNGDIAERKTFSDNGFSEEEKPVAPPLNRESMGQTPALGTPFAQVNTGQNSQLIDAVLNTVARYAEPESLVRIYDLYCGNGNFTFPIAKKYPSSHVVGVELNNENVNLAKSRARSEFTDQSIEFFQADVATFLTQKRAIPSSSNRAGDKTKGAASEKSVLILDPPRVGCAPGVMSAISTFNPSLIVYISCHPVTMARDLALLEKDQYELVSVTPFDMFPQTDHVETLVTLRQRSSTKNSGLFAHLGNL